MHLCKVMEELIRREKQSKKRNNIIFSQINLVGWFLTIRSFWNLWSKKGITFVELHQVQFKPIYIYIYKSSLDHTPTVSHHYNITLKLLQTKSTLAIIPIHSILIWNSPLLIWPFPTYMPFFVSTNLSNSMTNLKPFLLNSEQKTRFLRISGTCSTSFKVCFLPKVIFNITFSFPTTLEVEEFPMNISSPLSIGWYEENRFWSKHTWRIDPMSIHHSLISPPSKFTSEIIAKRSISSTSLERVSTSVMLAWEPFLVPWSWRLWQSLAQCPILPHT